MKPIKAAMHKMQHNDFDEEKSHFNRVFKDAFQFVEEKWDILDWSDEKLDIFEDSKLGELKNH